MPGPIAGRGILLAEEAEPGQEMGIAAELGEFVQGRKGSVEIRQKIMGTVAVALDSFGPAGSGEHLDLGFQDLIHAGPRSFHDIFSGGDKGTRCWTARANSCQTSSGASCT